MAVGGIGSGGFVRTGLFEQVTRAGGGGFGGGSAAVGVVIGGGCLGSGESQREVGVERYREWLEIALDEARAGAAEGGIPIGAALIGPGGEVLGRGRNRRVQDDDPSLHGETSAFRAAGRQRRYADTTMVTTLSPCWYCSGLVRQFGIGTLVIGETRNFHGGHDWLADHGTRVEVLDDPECTRLMAEFIATHPHLWHEDIGEA